MAEENNLVAMTIEVVASYVAHNNLRPDDVPGFIAQTHAAIAALTAAPQPEPAAEPESDAAPEHQPAVTVRRSLASREHILSMIDGKPYKTLKRHVARHGMTPAEYRQRYGLKADYPMTAPAYSEHRREVAKSLGLGRKPRVVEQEAEVAPEPAVTPASAAPPAERGRKAKASVDQAAAPAAAKRRGRPPKAAAPAEAE